MRFGRVSVCILTVGLLLGACALAQVDDQHSSQPASTATVPRLIRMQGAVRDEAGKPLSGRVGVTFALYKDQNDQELVWQENQNVQLDSAGRYSVLLGATNESGLPLEIFSAGEARWLGVRPDGQAEQPRILLLSVAYALKAADSEMLGGKPASAFVLADSQPSSAQLASGTPAGSPNSPRAPQILNWSPGAVPLIQPNASCSSVTSDGTATPNQISKFTSACNIQNSAIFELGGNVGIGNTSPAGMLDVSGATFIRGSLNVLGGAVFAPVQTATPAQGYASNPVDIEASAYNTSVGQAVSYVFRWQAAPVGNNSANTGATLNLLYGVPGLLNQTGLFVASNGILNFASGQTFPGTGSGTVTSVATGAGLTGGPITKTGTISIPAAGVSNSMLANSSVTVQAGSGLSGGGTVALGGTVTISAAGGNVATLPFFVTGGERTGASQAPTLNVTKLWGFLLPYNVITTEITYDVTTTDNTANNYDIGIFDGSGNLVANIGPTPGTTFAPTKSFRTLKWTQGSTALNAGRYYIAFTTNCSTLCAKVAAGPTYVSFALNVSAGASSGGALPSKMTPPADAWGTGLQPTVVIQ